MPRPELAKLARLLRLDRRDLPRAEWLRAGWPRLAPLIMLAVLPLALAGPLRAFMYWGLGTSFAVATAISVGLIALFWPALRRGDGRLGDALLGNGIVVVVGSFAVWLLFNRDFVGLVNMHGTTGLAIDGAFHVSIYHHFIRNQPDAYAGFVSMYTFWYALAHLPGANLPFAIEVTFCFGLFVTAIAPCIVSFSVLGERRDDRAAFWLGAVACLVASLLVQFFLVLPLESFHHMAGFWAPLFGLVPLSAMWWIDALVRKRLVRVLALLFVAAVYRHTYGLNLPELMATLATLLVVEALGGALPVISRVALGVGALVCAGASLRAFGVLKPLLSKAGWVLEHDLARVADGELWGVLALTLAILAVPARAEVARTGIVRALRFPLLFTLWDLVFMDLIARVPPAQHYYQHKYTFQAVVLLCGAFVVLVTFWVATVAHHFTRRTLAGLILCLGVVALSQRDLRRGFASYQPGFKEHAFGRPYHFAYPWMDRGAYFRIQRTLAQHNNAEFGGYLGNYWPLVVFENALFGHGDGDFWIHPTVTRAPGRCVFWEPGFGQGLDDNPAKHCVGYMERWSPNAPRTLCSLCD
jgi:hypothetical protein